MHVLSGLLTPLIALLAVYIAWQQHKTNRDHFRLALLERRLKVFNGTQELIGAVLRRTQIGPNELQKFLWETKEGDFLFGADITNYLHELYKRASLIWTYEEVTDQELRNERKDALIWFSGQGDEAKKNFAQYMAFTKHK
jgi:hypothetical protein